MSFGYAIGDFVLLTQLAWDVVQNSRKACGAHDELTSEVTGLHIVLRRLEVELSKPNSILTKCGDTLDRTEELAQLSEDCKRILKVLEGILKKYNALSEEKRSVMKLWKKVQFGNGEMLDLAELRIKIATSTSALTLFLNLLSIGSQGKVEMYMENQGDELREMKRSLNWITAEMQAKTPKAGEGSILTTYAGDDKSIWKDFRRELIKEGFSSEVLQRHKETIKEYVIELGSRGALDELEDDLGIKDLSFNGNLRAEDSELETATKEDQIETPAIEAEVKRKTKQKRVPDIGQEKISWNSSENFAGQHSEEGSPPKPVGKYINDGEETQLVIEAQDPGKEIRLSDEAAIEIQSLDEQLKEGQTQPGPPSADSARNHAPVISQHINIGSNLHGGNESNSPSREGSIMSDIGPNGVKIGDQTSDALRDPPAHQLEAYLDNDTSVQFFYNQYSSTPLPDLGLFGPHSQYLARLHTVFVVYTMYPVFQIEPSTRSTEYNPHRICHRIFCLARWHDEVEASKATLLSSHGQQNKFRPIAEELYLLVARACAYHKRATLWSNAAFTTELFQDMLEAFYRFIRDGIQYMLACNDAMQDDKESNPLKEIWVLDDNLSWLQDTDEFVMDQVVLNDEQKMYTVHQADAWGTVDFLRGLFQPDSNVHFGYVTDDNRPTPITCFMKELQSFLLSFKRGIEKHILEWESQPLWPGGPQLTYPQPPLRVTWPASIQPAIPEYEMVSAEVAKAAREWQACDQALEVWSFEKDYSRDKVDMSRFVTSENNLSAILTRGDVALEALFQARKRFYAERNPQETQETQETMFRRIFSTHPSKRSSEKIIRYGIEGAIRMRGEEALAMRGRAARPQETATNRMVEQIRMREEKARTDATKWRKQKKRGNRSHPRSVSRYFEDDEDEF